MKTTVKFTGTVEDLRKLTHDERLWLLALTDGICTGGHPNYILGRCEYLLAQGLLMTQTDTDK